MSSNETGTSEADQWRLEQEILGRPYRGEINREEAEAEAARHGLPPLAAKPSHDAYDPLTADRWTLAMTVAWIAWRSVDKVRETWPAYAEKAYDWHFREVRIGPDGPVHDCSWPETRNAPDVLRLHLLEILERDDPDIVAPVVTVKKAEQELWRALRRGSLKATAIHRPTRSRVAIPTEEWDDLDVTEEHDKDVLQRMRPWSPHDVCYDDVLFASAEVLKLWPRLPECLDRPPALVSMTGNGFTPLFRAAQWIATKGGTVDLGWEPDAWKAAYVELMARITAGEVELTGVRDGVRERVEGYQLAGCRVVHPFDNHAAAALELGPDLVLFSCACTGEDAWNDRLDDSLRNADGARWSRLMVQMDCVAKVWPASRNVVVEPYQRKRPGRPAPHRPLIEAELRARHARGEMLPEITQEAHELRRWLSATHPTVKLPERKTIGSIIRDVYNALKCSPKS